MVGFAGSAMPDLHFLTSHIPLIVWDEAATDQRTALAVNCGGTDVSAPVLRLNAQLEDGGWRCFLAFATPAGSDGRLVLKDSFETVLFSSDAPFQERDLVGSRSLDLGYMLSGLTDSGRVRLIRFLLHSCRTAFGLSTDVTYAANMKRFADELSLQPGSLKPCAFLTRNLVLLSGDVPVSIGTDAKVLAISEDSVQETPVPLCVDTNSRRGENERCFLVAIEKSVLSKDVCIVLTGAAGVAIKRVKVDGQIVDPIVSWLASEVQETPIYRDYALRCLTQLGQIDPSAASAIREIYALGQAQTIGSSGESDLQFLPECAVSAGDDLFVSGWFLDPHDLIKSVKIRVGDWLAVVDRQTLVTYSAADGRSKTALENRGMNFAVLAGGPGQPPTFGTAQITIQLRSGALIDGPQLALLDGNKTASRSILDALPADIVTDRQLDDVFAPALKARAEQDHGLPLSFGEIVNIGPRMQYAGASVLIPLASDTGIVTTWMSAIAAGVVDGLTNELIFVQPATADLALTERALSNLYRRSGVCTKLVRSETGNSIHDRLNAGVSAATCGRLVFLGETCFPSSENTLQTLLSVLDENGGIGLAGGAVLDPSGSIVHAGYTAPSDDRIGTAYAGFPAIELIRIAQRRAFACSSELFALARDDFDQIEGFSRKYLTRAWGDADFSRRICLSGKSLCFEHRARAIRFQFTGRIPKTETTLARRIDSRRFKGDWSDDLAQWSQVDLAVDGSQAPQSHGPVSARTGNARWAA